MTEKKKGTSKTPKNKKYYYSKGSIIRTMVLCLLCVALFMGFFVCFMIYGGNDRNSVAAYRVVRTEEKNVLSMIDGISADGKGRLYVFYSRTFDINVYDESGKFLENYQIPCSDGEVKEIYNGGIACLDGKLYAFNDIGEVFVYEDGKAVSSFSKGSDEDKFKEIYESYEKGKDEVVFDGKVKFRNNYVSVSADGKAIVKKGIIGLLFSPFSMVMAIVMTILSVFMVKRYNRKVRNQKIRTLFKSSVIIK